MNEQIRADFEKKIKLDKGVYWCDSAQCYMRDAGGGFTVHDRTANHRLEGWRAAHARYAQAAQPQVGDKCRIALENELAVMHATLEDYHSPFDALKALIDWHVKVALDPLVNGGKVLVPMEPTENMMNAGHAAAWRRIPSIFDLRDAKEVYQAMLTASQEQKP